MIDSSFRRPGMVPGLALAVVFSVTAGAAIAQTQIPQQPGEGSSTAEPPRITLWHGTEQPFGALGTPQRRVNILGNVGHTSGVNNVTYSLNGGVSRGVSFWPDKRRLNLEGDFNIDIPYQDLLAGSNTVRITAQGNSMETSSVTVNVYDYSGNVWPLPYTVAWSSAQSLFDSAQVVDGKWITFIDGLRIVEPGYDRLVAVGDTSWSDYEVTVRVTVQSIDSTAAAFSLTSGGPGVGILARWKGHTNTPTFTPPITQPLSGYVPFGALAWYHWRTGYGQTDNNRWEIMSTDFDISYRTHNDNPVMVYGVPYMFKLQVRTVPGQYTTYRFRAWQASQGEPGTWLMTWNEPLTGARNGSVLLLAHHVRATFGPLTITPVPDGTPPVISNVQVTPGATTAVVTWTTDEPSTSRVMYGLTPAYGSMVTDNQFVVSHSVTLQGLTADTEYHFLAVSTDWGGNTADAGNRTFRTTALPVPPAPSLASPANGTTGLPLTPPLVWTRPATATGFRLQVATDPSFASGMALHDSSLTDTSRTASGLAEGTRYNWRVRARNTAGEGPFSQTWQFVTALSAPSLVSPANGTGNLPPDATLRWRRVGAASAYHLQVAEDPSFATLVVVNDSTITDTARTVNGLANGRTYHWRVRSKTVEASSGFSGVWSFTVGLAPPVLIAPADNAPDMPTVVTFRWRTVPFASTYGVQVSTDPAFLSGLVVNDSMIVDTSFTFGGLSTSTLYYWRVRARNGGGTGSVSAAWRFSTALPSPVLLSPSNGAQDLPLSVTFRWGSVPPATGYWYELATDSLFQTGIVKNDTLLADTVRTVHGLVYGTRYYWRVRARNGTGRSFPSSVWVCRTAGRVPDPVALIAPAAGGSVGSDSARFHWAASQPGVDRYWFEIALDSLFTFGFIDSSAADTVRVMRSLLADRRYWWRVRAHNSEGWGPFSPVRSVQVTLTSVADGGTLPADYTLRQNFPNPFNPTTTLEFDLPGGAEVRLEVFNVLGERVALLVDGGRPAGRHREVFDASDHPSGVYLARLVTPAGARVIRMLLMK